MAEDDEAPPPRPLRRVGHASQAASEARRMEVMQRRMAIAERKAAERFESVVALPADDGAAASHGATLAALRDAEVRGIGRVVYSSNAVFVLELDAADPYDPARPLRGIYKPTRGERPLWDFPFGTLQFREVASYLVDAALGTDLVPPTTLRGGPAGMGSVQLFVDVVEHDLDAEERARLEPPLRAMAALDMLINNADRKSAHLLVTAHGLQGIDQGLTFLPYPRQRTVLLELGGSSLPSGTARRVRGLSEDEDRRAALRARLARLLDPDEVDGFESRLDQLAVDPVYPVLDPWDGRPFEWW